MQKDGNAIAGEVRKVNGEFYRAFEGLSIETVRWYSILIVIFCMAQYYYGKPQ
jgi:hypothetical protein